MRGGYLVVAAPVPQAQKRHELQKVVDESRRRDINRNYRSKLSRRFVAHLSFLSWKTFLYRIPIFGAQPSKTDFARILTANPTWILVLEVKKALPGRRWMEWSSWVLVSEPTKVFSGGHWMEWNGGAVQVIEGDLSQPILLRPCFTFRNQNYSHHHKRQNN